jgi:hypothetical protein
VYTITTDAVIQPNVTDVFIPMRLRPAFAGNITGIAFNDANANGVRDSGEAGVSGALIYIDIGGPSGNGPDGQYTIGVDIVANQLVAQPGLYNFGSALPAGNRIDRNKLGLPRHSRYRRADNR